MEELITEFENLRQLLDEEGEHVGFDGESERSEDEEMNDSDREFRNDESDEEIPGPSHLALLNAQRYDDDENALNR